jgi:GNAT superfamily N-acetyltransferase
MKIQTTSFEASKADISSIRDTVFCLEQNIPRDIEWDGEDSECTHVIASHHNGTSIGTGRIKSDGKIGRLAILKDFRGQGIGERVLMSLIDVARDKGLKQVYLHARFRQNLSTATEASKKMVMNLLKPISDTSRWCLKLRNNSQSNSTGRKGYK